MPSESFEVFKRTKFFGSLDGLRALAIIAVIWHHMKSGPADYAYFAWARHGVTMFFVLSGFLITTLLLREKEASGKIDLGKFYMRRTLRIFPVYYLVLLVYCLLVKFTENDLAAAERFWHNLPYFLTYTTNIFVPPSDPPRIIFYFAWSLATEEQFYLVWPVTIKLLRAWAVPFLITLLTCRQIYLSMVEVGLFHDIVRSISPAICIGALLAFLLNDERGFEGFSAIFSLAFVPAIMLALVCINLMFGFSDLLDGYWFALLTALLIGSCVIKEKHELSWFFGWPLIEKTGVLSYGMYLAHMIALNVIKKFMPDITLPFKFVATLSLTFVVAWTLYYFYERPFLKLKERFR